MTTSLVLTIQAILWRNALHRLASTCLVLLQTLQGKGDNISDSCLSSQLVFQRHRHSDRRSRHQQTHGKSCTNTYLVIHEYTMQHNDDDMRALWMLASLRRMFQRIPLTAYISKRTTTKMPNVGLASKHKNKNTIDRPSILLPSSCPCTRIFQCLRALVPSYFAAPCTPQTSINMTSAAANSTRQSTNQN